jgi:hypothetical protein
MSFLQPYILWALPLALLPVLIHLFNRLRHRSVPWAAMMFLRSATRKSTRYARLRQFLILAFRVLAVIGLIFGISRPLAGGWAGWMLSATPDAIIVLFDRSASMESKQNEIARRETAAKFIAQSAKTLEDTSHLILIDSATRTPQDVPNAAALPEISLAAQTDTAADVPAMIQAALDWIHQTKPGSAEIWIASDLQSSNWQPMSDRWAALANGLGSLPQGVRLRLLALDGEAQPDVAVLIIEATRKGTTLDLVFDLERNNGGPLTLPVTISVDGAPAQVEIKMDGESLRYRHRVPLNSASGWGFVDLPADGNARNNRAFFVYGPPPALRAAVVSSDAINGPVLKLAVSPDPRNSNQVCQLITSVTPDTVHFDDLALVLWQAPLPEGDTAKRLTAFIEAGGVAVFFPSGKPGQFAGGGWGETQTSEKPFPASRWEDREGPLAKTEEGFNLPVSGLEIKKRQAIVGEKVFLAAFDDGAPLLTRRTLGKGQILFCAIQPKKDWSRLAEGPVLVPMVQRLLETGGHRFSLAASVACGDWAGNGTSIDTPKDIRTQTGIYRSGGQLIAVNRPAREDDRERLDPAQVKALFGNVPVQLFEQKQGVNKALQSELWRFFLFCMLLFLLAEAILILPERQSKQTSDLPLPKPEAEKPQEALT